MIDSQSTPPKAERPKLPTAKWGAACAACATAKAKCIRSNETPGTKCDRCERLLKDCTDQVHRPRKKRQTKPSRTAQIEQRLNGLVSLLKSTGEYSDIHHGESSHTGANHPHSLPYASEHNQFASTIGSDSSDPGSWSIDPRYNSLAPKACLCHPGNLESAPPPDPDDAMLDFYRQTIQTVHPFVVIPPHVTAGALQAERPFLMAAIRMVCSFRSLRSMRAQMYHLMNHVADHMLIRSEKSLELLLGIIVMLGYQQYHCYQHGQLNNLIALAVTLVGDLALNRPPGHYERTSLLVAQPPETACRTNEERRALAGAWYWASVISMNFGRIEPMRYNRYVQDCIRHLEARRECETDTTLSAIVRIQRLSERITDFNSKDKASDMSCMPTSSNSAYLGAFQSELESLSTSLPPHLQMDKPIQLFLSTARLRLFEPPAVDSALVNSISESLTLRSIGAGSPLDKVYQSSAALTAWFNAWLNVPVPSYYYQTTAVGSHLVYALTMLGRWAKLVTPRFEGNTPMSQDESTDTSSVSLYDSDIAQSQCETGPGSSRVSTPLSTHHEPLGGRGPPPRSYAPDSDPDLPTAVAALRAQLQTQPGLVVNIPEILSALCNRFEQANATFQTCSADPERMHNNLWLSTALKIRITRAKLERWAELVSAGTDALNLDGDDVEGLKMQEWFGSMPHLTEPGLHHHHHMGFPDDGTTLVQDPLQPEPHLQNAGPSTPWTSELLAGIDPDIWFDGNLDWGSVIMNSMGSVER